MIPATSTTVPSPPTPHRQTAFVPGRDRTRSRNLAKRPGGDPRPAPWEEPDSPRRLPCWSARPGTVTAQPIRSRGETCPCCRSLNVSPRSLPLCQPRTVTAQPHCKARAPTVMPPRVLGHIRDTAASWHPICFNAHGVQQRGARRGAAPWASWAARPVRRVPPGCTSPAATCVQPRHTVSNAVRLALYRAAGPQLLD